MPDREKVIKGITVCFTLNSNCKDCPYDCEGKVPNCTKALSKNALALLKEQDAVKPRVSTVEQRCGNCNKVIEMDGWIACPWCGKPILWEAVGRSVK